MTWQLDKVRDGLMVCSGTNLWSKCKYQGVQHCSLMDTEMWLTVILSACVLFEHEVLRRKNSSFIPLDYWQTTSSELCRNAKHYTVTWCDLELELCVRLCSGRRAARVRKLSEVLHRSGNWCPEINHTASSRDSYYEEQKQKQTKIQTPAG